MIQLFISEPNWRGGSVNCTCEQQSKAELCPSGAGCCIEDVRGHGEGSCRRYALHANGWRPDFCDEMRCDACSFAVMSSQLPRAKTNRRLSLKGALQASHTHALDRPGQLVDGRWKMRLFDTGSTTSSGAVICCWLVVTSSAPRCCCERVPIAQCSV